MSQEIELGVSSVPTREASPLDTREQSLLATYDFMKHMSTMALVSVGGMLGIAQSVMTHLPRAVVTSVALVGASGFLSLLFMTAATLTQVMQRVHKTSKALSLIMVMTILTMFSSGVEGFMMEVFRALGH